MNPNELIIRMTDIEAEVKMHESALADLRSEGQTLFGEFESWRAGLTFASSAAVEGKATKAGDKDLKTALRLAAKRSIQQKAKDGASAKDVALAAAQKYVEKRGLELPVWFADWTDKYVDKIYPQPRVETPAAEVTEPKEIEPEPAVEAPKGKRKK